MGNQGKPYRTKLLTVADNEAIPFTIKMIGQAIKAGSKYPPIIHHARALATTAPPKNYYLQLKAIYNDVIKNWRYVKDPYQVETLATDPGALFNLVLGNNGGAGKGKGAGDCDDITAALGALLRAIGFPIRIVTSSPPGRPGQYSHVFIQARLPIRGWITVDPVLHPSKPMGAIAPHSSLGYWDLEGNKTGGELKTALESLEGFNQMEDYQTFELSGVDGYEDGEYLEDWTEDLPGFGCALGACGYIGNANALDIELTTNDLIDRERGLYMTPMLAMNPDDLQFVEVAGVPLPGMRAMGDNGFIYEWIEEPIAPGLGGPFKRFFKKVGKGIKKVGSAIKKGYKYVKGKIRKVMSKTAFGRFVLRVKDKIVSVAMKIVKPMAKFVGKWALKLAPVAALIPGVGPAIAGALAAAGTIAKMYNKYSAIVEKITIKDDDGNFQPFEKIQFPNKAAELAFKKDLTNEAGKMAKRSKKEIDALNTKLRNTPLPKKLSPFERVAIMINAKKAEAEAAKAAELAKKAAAFRAKAQATARASAKGRAAAIARARNTAAAARTAAAQAASQRAPGAAAGAAMAHQAQMMKEAAAKKEAIADFKKLQAKKPKKQRFKENVTALKKMGYRVKIRKAA